METGALYCVLWVSFIYTARDGINCETKFILAACSLMNIGNQPHSITVIAKGFERYVTGVERLKSSVLVDLIVSHNYSLTSVSN